MKIFTIVIAIIICIGLYIFMKYKADKKERNLFEWGYTTGLLASFILEIAFKMI